MIFSLRASRSFTHRSAFCGEADFFQHLHRFLVGPAVQGPSSAPMALTMAEYMSGSVDAVTRARTSRR